uniref:Uncharacterized protein n=1 Tax=Glossina austeni TaxID=7395 RepID=A0A1A9V0Z1_GLOAU
MADYKVVEVNDLGKLQTLEYDESNTKAGALNKLKTQQRGCFISNAILNQIRERSCLASIIYLPEKCLRTYSPKFDKFYCLRKCWINVTGYEDKRISILIEYSGIINSNLWKLACTFPTIGFLVSDNIMLCFVSSKFLNFQLDYNSSSTLASC